MENKGITLIALIITIIIMLILVGVTVRVAINSNLINTAQETGETYKQAYANESALKNIIIDDKEYNSIEGYLSTGGVELITFTIDGTGLVGIQKCQAEAGMTWYEWANSSYNLNGWFCIGRYNGVTCGAAAIASDENKTRVYGSNTIEANATYYAFDDSL